jgi:hypothetical protein
MGQPMAPNYSDKNGSSVCDIPFHTLDGISDKIYNYEIANKISHCFDFIIKDLFFSILKSCEV